MTETQQRNYRVTFILNTREYDQPVETLVGTIKDGVQAEGATLGEVRNLGRQEFVRVTDKRHTGDVYLQMDITCAPEVPGKITEHFRLDKNVERILLESR
jgi:ribosomal protein S6